MIKTISKNKKWLVVLVAVIVMLAMPIAYADTDGTELLVTDEPAQLIIHLGTDWAGAAFELKTDAGVYPQPVVVGQDGLLTTELGGSKTYILSALQSSLPAQQSGTEGTHPEDGLASPAPRQSDTPEKSAPASKDIPEDVQPPSELPTAGANNIGGIPTMHLILFAGGLFVCAVVLFVMYVLKRRKESDVDDDDYFEE